jgi:16S rRNA (uracil1498-N3)-methyltransferase
MQLFYKPDILENNVLSEEESKHCIKVLRMQEGHTLQLIDGNGGFYTARIIDSHYKRCKIEIIEETQNFEKRDYYIHIAIAPTKNLDRMEWFVEKCVEIGVNEITFLASNHCERKVLKLERLQKIAISAMKQSLKAYLPILNELIPFDKFVKNNQQSSKMIAHLEEDDRKNIQSIEHKEANYCILIGPEGDFSSNEIKLAYENGFQAVTLGNSRLRTETAGIVACHSLNLLHK